ncbi:MAG: VTT domain-containing protein [Pyrinomonadaceae bacterium]
MLGKRRWLIVVGVCLLLAAFFHEPLGRMVRTDYLAGLGETGFSAGAIFFILAASTLVSEDLTCLTAGTLVSQGRMGFPLAVAACGFGIFFGDILLFLAGRFFGRKALRIKFIGGMFSAGSVRAAASWLEKYGMAAVLLSRFTPGLRLPLYLTAGILQTDFLKFTLYFLLATALWTPVIVGVPAFFGREIMESKLFGGNFWLGFVVVVAGFYLLLRLALKLTTHKGRRLLLGRIKRIYKWEFWSLRVFYFPIVIYILGLMVKHRHPTVFTSANPAIPAGGFVGERKRQILQGLETEAARPFLLRFAFIDGALSLPQKITEVRDFMNENDLRFPIAVKPDVGERGADVFLIRSDEELEKVLGGGRRDLIVQEFAAGEEVSVFYYRRPDRPAGRIFSITEKRFPEVTGDGRSTLEELILNDSRAICLAEKYFDRNRERLFEVPEKGEKVSIIDIGTHSRGAIFLDGGHLKTDALEEKIDEICRGFEGFYFGRFDIRTASHEDFRRGANFKIIELNGVTSEATNIYDPRHTLFDAYRILFRQWRIAFEIGAENRRRGVAPVPVRQMIKMIRSHLGGEPAKINSAAPFPPNPLKSEIRNPKSEI